MRKVVFPMAAVVLLFVSCNQPMDVLPPPILNQRTEALAIIADPKIDLRVSDPAFEDMTAQVVYSDGAVQEESLLSLLSDSSVFETAGVKQLELKKDSATASVELFVYDSTLSELQESMGEKIDAADYASLATLCQDKFILVDDASLAGGPVTVMGDYSSIPVFKNTYFRGHAGMDNLSFTGGEKAWDTMADISADNITFDSLSIKLTDLRGSSSKPTITGIGITGENTIIKDSSFANDVDNETKKFFGINIATSTGKTEISDVSLTGFDVALAVESGEAEVKDVTFDGVIAFKIDDVSDFSNISLSGCKALNDHSSTEYDVIIVGTDEVVGSGVKEADAWVKQMEALNPGLVFGRAKTLEVGGAEIEGWEPVDGGEVDAGM
ncbi:MAG: hypothetical protein IAA97_01535 [Spirochaetes bacterium]|uniref:Lipoprotein n=1 Tax=Candidatus Ornithospirochaeta stercoripullorum TaxID=2840899 RepID=A0A9D9DWU8_9SPIO|nr:hypothetical protein [Candidatus Ornithospirochaeta stercoripullorum]